MKVLLSIKPEFVEKIFSGNKKFEYRKALFKNKNVSTVVVYSTMPTGKIVGEFEVRKIFKDNPNQLWDLTKDHSGVEVGFYNQYFGGRQHGFAIEIVEPYLYEIPIDPKAIFERFTPPQSFLYLDNYDKVIAEKMKYCIIRSNKQ